jgi:quercetin dioxygenase-like cupin family protein
MTDTLTTTSLSPALVEAGGGDHFHFLNHLATVKSSHERTLSGMNAVEFTAPRGFGPPLHLHHEEDEIMYVADGEVRVEIDGEARVAGAGAVIALPARVAHTFQVTSEWATFLTVAGGQREAAPFDAFVAALGAPVEEASQPQPSPIDPGHVAAVAAAHGIEILGPPPAPLD